MLKKHLFSTKNSGNILLFVLIFGTLAFMMVIGGVASYGLLQNRLSKRTHDYSSAINIAEAGVNYYRWHLSIDSDDFTDGTGGEGPYLHEYHDKNGALSGYYALDIDAPTSTGGTITIRSTGWTILAPRTKRTLQVRIAFQSPTDYLYLSNSNISFPEEMGISGKIHSNGSIIFDAQTDSPITSAVENGISGSGGPVGFFDSPVAPIPFDAMTGDISSLRTQSFLNNGYIAPANGIGWQVILSPNGTYKLYEITQAQCFDGYCYDANNGNRTYAGSFNIPANGIIFVEDDVWVDGSTDRPVTIVAGTLPDLPGNRKNIIIDNNLEYQQFNSDDVIGLLAQGDVIIPKNIPSDIDIQAAIISQNGSIYRPHYSNHTPNHLDIIGSLTFASSSVFQYFTGDDLDSGFTNVSATYDSNLRYQRPPGFPVSPTYEIISWEEIQS